jgi:hypothetical protein
MSHTPETLIIGGDFNYTQVTADTTETPTPSRALKEILNGMDLVDTWNQPQDRPQYTHYTSIGASRIDRIYVTRALLSRKVVTQILPAAYTDHHTVVLSIRIDQNTIWRARKPWQLNSTIIATEAYRTDLRNKWQEWMKAEKYYPDRTTW